MYVENAKDNALYYCEKDREEYDITAPCEILALGNKIVWEEETVPILASELNTYFDGPWHGTMMCGTCENCVGPLTKEVQIDIQEGSFEIVMDATYHGEGTVDKKGDMEIHYTAGVNWRPRFRPTFEFAGKLVGKIFQLEGNRGSRTCNLSLSRLTS
jgi:hypothetical protein